jgi:hypothetical protein
VPVSAALLRGIYRYAAGQCLLAEFVLIVFSSLSQNLSGLFDAQQQVERLKTQQFDPYQLATPIRMWVLQSLNLPFFSWSYGSANHDNSVTARSSSEFY